MKVLASCSTLSPIHCCEPLPALTTKSLSALIVKKKELKIISLLLIYREQAPCVQLIHRSKTFHIQKLWERLTNMQGLACCHESNGKRVTQNPGIPPVTWVCVHPCPPLLIGIFSCGTKRALTVLCQLVSGERIGKDSQAMKVLPWL